MSGKVTTTMLVSNETFFHNLGLKHEEFARKRGESTEDWLNRCLAHYAGSGTTISAWLGSTMLQTEVSQ